MKLLFALLFISALAIGQTVTIRQSWISDGDRALLIKGRIAGELKNWLIIESHNGGEWKQNGFDPTYTRLVSDYKPLFRKLPNGQWEVMWVSEIAEKLP